MKPNKAFHHYGAQGAPRVNADVGSRKMKSRTIILAAIIGFMVTGCRSPWPQRSHSYELAAMVADHGALTSAAEGERRLLTWNAPTNPIPDTILSAVNSKGDISGWWMTPMDPMGYSDSLATALIESNRYLVVYFSDSDTIFYRYERHGFLNDGILTLERPIEGGSAPFNEILLISTPEGNVLVPRTTADSKYFTGILAGERHWDCFYPAGWRKVDDSAHNRLNLNLEE